MSSSKYRPVFSSRSLILCANTVQSLGKIREYLQCKYSWMQDCRIVWCVIWSVRHMAKAMAFYEYEYWTEHNIIAKLCCSEPNPSVKRVRWSTGPRQCPQREVQRALFLGTILPIVPTRAPAIITRPNDSYDNAPPAPGTFYRGRGRTQLKNMFPVAVFLSTFILIGRSRCSNNSKYSICMKYIVQ